MSMFEVPGWSVGTDPVQENGATPSKKRKRSATNDHQALEKTKEGPKSGSSDAASLNISRPKPLKPRISVDEDTSRPTKKAKTRDSVSPSTIASTLTLAPSTSYGPKLTALQQGMKQSLDGARFRMINETLYKSESAEAHRLMQEDPKVFEEPKYHVGFRHQVQSWPTNPVEHYIMDLSSRPSKTVIADLGCGDAALAKALIPRGLNVLSYDLVSDGEFVVEADVCEQMPLPGSEGGSKEKTSGSAQVVDIVVCALSLMGTNWPKCLREAWRILKPEGELKIAEVTSRFTDVEEFQNVIGDIGFRFRSKDERNTHFTLFEFKKVARKPKTDSEWAKLISRGEILKPYSPTQLSTTNFPSFASRQPVRRSSARQGFQLNFGYVPLTQKKQGIERISFILGYEASKDLQTETFQGQTPVSTFQGERIKAKVALTPILRAGLGMTDALLSLYPDAPVYHLGLFREKVTLQPVEYYSKLPPSPPCDQVFLLDPLIATGGTAIAALTMITEWGISVNRIKLLSVLASQEGLDHIKAQYPELEIWVAGIDPVLTGEGIISPGLGDTGDRLFNTIRT
ncbi:hypothetical protein NP233_g1296 [Leucocoprinus birnbaumii]|uniref:Ribosomal RNA-processing protein 8 n=1 Tax=Leucocoprinus birnbaumii TaxID=56174 RepID=A0AAD5W1B5_9AGAR|nr:hypothetical protein NP233_g1296 [Leucocoprinus birnbaumii]